MPQVLVQRPPRQLLTRELTENASCPLLASAHAAVFYIKYNLLTMFFHLYPPLEHTLPQDRGSITIP